MKFVGLNTEYLNVNGKNSRRIYLDSTATTLAMKESRDCVDSFMKHYSNTHSEIHNSSRISTDVLDWAHETVLNYFSVTQDKYTALFSGSGCTSAVNVFSKKMRARNQSSPVYISLMEHHSNDIPHRMNAGSVRHIALRQYSDGLGEIDLDALRQAIEEEKPAYISISAVSNVTGIINPVKDIAKIANSRNIPLLIDMASAAAHWPCTLETDEYYIDAIAFSSHKIYAPSGPGVLIIRNQLLQQLPVVDFGGGAVTHVTRSKYVLEENLFHRENPGTPNLPGIVALAAALKKLIHFGVEKLYQYEANLTSYMIKKLSSIKNVKIYGSLDPAVKRISTVSFNISGVPHGLTGAILNDYFNIAVRNQCFCAHPYVKQLILGDFINEDDDVPYEDMYTDIDQYRGMVRASIAMYSTYSDIDKLVEAVNNICEAPRKFTSEYLWNEVGFTHKRFRLKYDVEQLLGMSDTSLNGVIVE
jgi:selenocysteine lyase/cysteine desulfurase